MSLAAKVKAGCFHHVSSIAAAGLYNGVFREDMFDEAEHLEHPYFASKHESGEGRAQGVQDAMARLSPGHRRR